MFQRGEHLIKRPALCGDGECLFFGKPFSDFSLSRHHRAVISAAEVGADLAVRCVGQLSTQEHRQHSWVADRALAFAGFQIIGINSEQVTDRRFHFVNPHSSNAVGREFRQNLLCNGTRDGFSSHRMVCRQAVQTAFEFPDVVLESLCEFALGLFRNSSIQPGCLAFNNAKTRFKIW